MDNSVSNQLLTEIRKIKANDYTSYQNFYNETSQYLYGVIWNNVNDKTVADSLINYLYTEIYSSIGSELTDDSQFYAWAEQKAKTLSTTYIAENGQPNEKKGREKEAAAAAIANAGIDVASAGMGGASSAAAGEAASVGMGSVAGGAANAGMGTVAGGAASAGTAGAVATAAKAGIGLGAKIAIGATAAALAVGIGVGAFLTLDKKQKDSKKTTETTIEAFSEEETEEITEEKVSETTEELTTEEASADEIVLDAETSAAYLDVAKQYGVDHPMIVEGGSYREYFALGFTFAKLVDFEGNGKYQLVLVNLEGESYRSVSKITVDIYDYIDGNAVNTGSFDYEGDTDLGVGWPLLKLLFVEENGRTSMWIAEDGEDITYNNEYQYNIIQLDYIDGQVVKSNQYTKVLQGEYLNAIEYEITSTTYLINGEAADSSEYDSKLSMICNNKDTYEFGLAATKMLLEKHNLMKTMATTAGNDEFVNGDSGLTINTDEEQYITYKNTKYNETYHVWGYGYDANYGAEYDKRVPQTTYGIISNDQLTFRNKYWGNGQELGVADTYYTYINDVLILAGWMEMHGADCYWMTEQDYLDGNIATNAITINELQENAKPLMER